LSFELYIAQRIVTDKQNRKSISRAIINIALFSIVLGMTVMILSIAIITGFKKEIESKVIGFGSHITITNLDNNSSFETKPISKIQSFYPDIQNEEGIKHIQIYALKPGIIKTKTDIQGIIIKGIGEDFDWRFFQQNLVQGQVFTVAKAKKTNDVIISKYLADLLHLKLNDTLHTFFLQDQPRLRNFYVKGIYQTSLEEFDKTFILADIAHIQKLNAWSEDQITGFEILLDDFKDIDNMTEKVGETVGNIFDSQGNTLYVKNIRQSYPDIFDWLELTNTNVWVILILMTLVAGINMISGVLVLIIERTNMIGMLKALGAGNRQIRKIFLYNSIFLVGKGVLIGNFVGLSICLLQQYFGIIKLDAATYYVSTVPIHLDAFLLIALNAGAFLLISILLILPSYIIGTIEPVKSIKFN